MIDFYQGGMFFAEKPVSKEEREIAEAFQHLWQARTKKDEEGVLACYTDNALIKPLRYHKYLTKKEYAMYLSSSLQKHYVSRYDNLIIRIKEKNTAEVQSLSYFRYTDKSWGPAYQYFLLKKFETGWKIVKSHWLEN